MLVSCSISISWLDPSPALLPAPPGAVDGLLYQSLSLDAVVNPCQTETTGEGTAGARVARSSWLPGPKGAAVPQCPIALPADVVPRTAEEVKVGII